MPENLSKAQAKQVSKKLLVIFTDRLRWRATVAGFDLQVRQDGTLKLANPLLPG